MLNSLYGALGNSWFRYFDLRMAEGITTSGQLSIRWMADRLNAFMNKTLKTEGEDFVIAIDTDSIYLALGKLVEKTCPNKTTDQTIKYLDRICTEVFMPFIDKGYQELAEYMNAYQQKMQMKREVLADKAIWCCHPNTKVVIDNATITLEHLYAISERGIVDKEIISYNTKMERYEIDIVEEVIRRPYEGYMYEFTFEDGSNLNVTGDHIVFIIRDGELVEMPASEVRATDEFFTILVS